MEAAHSSAHLPGGTYQEAPAPTKTVDNARRCLATGDMLPKDQLIRFVVGPDQKVVPDLAQNLPGRGFWVTASFAMIAQAAKKNLFSKAAKMSVQASSDLAGQTAQLIQKRCLDFLGLARRSGLAVLGQGQVEGELKSGKLALLLLAIDAASGFDGFRASKDVPSYKIFSRNELGAALGQDQLVYVGLKPHNLTEKLGAELARLEKMAPTSHLSQGTDKQ